MRTTVEISDRFRARLLQSAAERGEKGFSGILDEALELYFRHVDARADAVRAALALRGAISEEEAAELERSVEAMRARWR